MFGPLWVLHFFIVGFLLHPSFVPLKGVILASAPLPGISSGALRAFDVPSKTSSFYTWCWPSPYALSLQGLPKTIFYYVSIVNPYLGSSKASRIELGGGGCQRADVVPFP